MLKPNFSDLIFSDAGIIREPEVLVNWPKLGPFTKSFLVSRNYKVYIWLFWDFFPVNQGSTKKVFSFNKIP